MTATLGTLIASTRKLMNEVGDTVKYTDADIVDALNWAHLDVVTDSVNEEAFRTGGTYDAVAGAVAFPAGCHGQLLAQYRASASASWSNLEGKMAHAMDLDCPGWRDSTGTPTSIVAEASATGWNYRLYPAPTATVTDGLSLRWCARPDAMELADDTPIALVMVPDEFDAFLLPFGAAAMLFQSESGAEDDQAEKFWQLFGAQKSRYNARLNQLLCLGNTR